MNRPVNNSEATRKKATAARAAEPFDFVAIVGQYESPLLRYVGQLLGSNRDGAEEAVQEAFLRLHRQVSEHGRASIENLSAWLFRVAHNLAISTVRRRELERRLREESKDDPLADGADGEPVNALDVLVRKEMCERALAELQMLPQKHKEVVLLKIIQGFSFREIGEITGLSVSHVSYRMNQGLRELSRRLKGAGLA
ncbi:MAG TPA: RNA polymerase sigma factor [Planctomycetota bacterium]|nr:RNA polymerase sigma factor [Planctomycetota bacterium]